MKHPSEATLALYAGQDLGAFACWRTERHLARCPRCRSQAAEFSDLRQEITGLNELPGIAWNRLAAEMKANIRLGLAAGECIRDTRPVVGSWFAGARAAVACFSVAILLAAGVWLERPAPPPAAAEREPGILLRETGNGIEVRVGDQAMVLKNGPGEDVIYSAGAQGSIGARFVDPNGYGATINTFYVQ